MNVLWSWIEMKRAVERSIPFDADWLHLIAGLLILVAAAAIARRPLRSWVPFAIVLILATTNEIIDLAFREKINRASDLHESLTDLLLTLALPALIMIVARFRGGVSGRRL